MQRDLSFADDSILCCKGDFASIYLLLVAFKLFSSESTGWKTNVSKSFMFTCGMDPVEEQKVSISQDLLNTSCLSSIWVYLFVLRGYLQLSVRYSQRRWQARLGSGAPEIYHTQPGFNLLTLYYSVTYVLGTCFHID